MLKLYFVFFTDCGNNATIAHGHIDFTNADTTFGQSVSVTCNTGYDLFGGHTIQCLADGSWSKTVSCVIKGEVLFCCSVYFLIYCDTIGGCVIVLLFDIRIVLYNRF